MVKYSLKKMKMTMKFLHAVFILIWLTTCDQSFNLVDIIDGPSGEKLSLSPESSQVFVNDITTLKASGGVPPYIFSIISGNGVINSSTGIYTAPSLSGTDIVSVTDSYGATDSSEVTIISGTGPVSLTLSPVEISVYIGSNVTFSTTGGVAPYTYSLSPGMGSIDSATGVYSAPSTIGTDTVIVTDNEGASTSATVTISSLQTNVDYSITLVNDNSGTTVGGDALSGDFTITNIGSAKGNKPISWDVFLSLGDDIFSVDDQLIDSGSSTQLASGDSITENFSGTWPEDGGTYYFIIRSYSTDDIEYTANNISTSGSIALSAPIIDYHVNSVPAGGTTILRGSAISESFTIENLGTSNGYLDIYWTAYISNDATLDMGTDIVFDSGIHTFLPAGFISAGINISGDWLQSTGNYFIIIGLSAGDDTNGANNDSSSPASYTVTDPNIDYLVTSGSISTVNNPAIGGSNINETFTISNTGSDNGSETVYWTAYISTDNTFDNPGDIPIDSGQIGSLNAGQTSVSISIDNGSWPSVSGTTAYHLFVDLSASDELPANNGNNSESSTFSITMPDIDYQVLSVSNVNTPANINTAISEIFAYNNTGADDGTSDVIWIAYISTDQVFDINDTIIDSGTAGSLANGATSASIPINGTWPATAGIYYIFVTLFSSDETNITNNDNFSSFISINAPGDIDYITTGISSDYLTVTTGSPVSETFNITNAGGVAGSTPVNWEAFVSADQLWDVGDESIGSGTISALGAGSSSTGNTINGTWTGTAGNYYLIVKIDSADETLNSNNECYSGIYRVYAPPDYIITNISMPLELYGGNINDNLNLADGTHSFRIKENAGNDGNQTVSWAVYLSSDASLDGTDTIADSGTISALTANAASSTIPIDFNLPSVPGYYYYIIQISSGDDSNYGNNSYTTSAVQIWQNTGNIEIDEIGNDIYLSNAVDYSVILNSADTINITGRIDTIVGNADLYLISTGPATTSLDISMNWINTKVDLDINVFASDTTMVGSSTDSSTTAEPSAGVLSVSGLTADSEYYIMISVFNFNNPITSGDNYSLIITGQ